MEHLFNFSEALNSVKEGSFIARDGWNGKGQSVFLKRPLDTDVGTPTVPHLLLINAQGDIVPWVPSQGDLFAEDWKVRPSLEEAEPSRG